METSTANTKMDIFRKALNVVAYLGFLSSNAYSVAKGQDGWYGRHDTYITPASWDFIWWPVIHFGFLGYVIYQWFEPAREVEKRGVGWKFIIISVLNSIWSSLWLNGHLILSFVAILLVAMNVSWTYYTLKRHYTPKNFNDTLWIHAPFSIWHAFSTVIVVVNLFAAFTPDRTPGEAPSLLVTILACIALFVIHSFLHGYIYLGKGDLIGGVVLTLTFFAVFQHQDTATVIRWFSFALGIISAIAIARILITKEKATSLVATDEERTPLVA